jgi:hypothetical protein
MILLLSWRPGWLPIQEASGMPPLEVQAPERRLYLP